MQKQALAVEQSSCNVHNKAESFENVQTTFAECSKFFLKISKHEKKCKPEVGRVLKKCNFKDFSFFLHGIA
jgi:hypothetical protein